VENSFPALSASFFGGGLHGSAQSQVQASRKIYIYICVYTDVHSLMDIYGGQKRSRLIALLTLNNHLQSGIRRGDELIQMG